MFLALPANRAPATASLSPPRLFNLTVNASFLGFSALALRPPMLGRLRGAFSEDSGATNVPGPIDFRGALVFVPVLLKELGGKWLCRLLLRTEVVVAADAIDSDFEELRLRLLEALLCCLCKPFFPIDPVPDTLRVLATGAIGCGIVVAASSAMGGVVVALPGKGKWLRLG